MPLFPPIEISGFLASSFFRSKAAIAAAAPDADRNPSGGAGIARSVLGPACVFGLKPGREGALGNEGIAPIARPGGGLGKRSASSRLFASVFFDLCFAPRSDCDGPISLLIMRAILSASACMSWPWIGGLMRLAESRIVLESGPNSAGDFVLRGRGRFKLLDRRRVLGRLDALLDEPDSEDELASLSEEDERRLRLPATTLRELERRSRLSFRMPSRGGRCCVRYTLSKEGAKRVS